MAHLLLIESKSAASSSSSMTPRNACCCCPIELIDARSSVWEGLEHLLKIVVLTRWHVLFWPNGIEFSCMSDDRWAERLARPLMFWRSLCRPTEKGVKAQRFFWLTLCLQDLHRAYFLQDGDYCKVLVQCTR